MICLELIGKSTNDGLIVIASYFPPDITNKRCSHDVTNELINRIKSDYRDPTIYRYHEFKGLYRKRNRREVG